MIYLELFLSFLQVGAFSIGGGYASIPLIQSQVVERHGWLTMGEFTDLVTISQMTPGPIAINSATFVRIRIAGIGGALVATWGCILPSCLIVSLLAYIYRRYKSASAVDTVLGCLRPAVVALILAAGLSMLQTAAFIESESGLAAIQWVSILLFLGAFFLLRKWKWNPIGVMCLCGGLNVLLYLFTGIAAL